MTLFSSLLLLTVLFPKQDPSIIEVRFEQVSRATSKSILIRKDSTFIIENNKMTDQLSELQTATKVKRWKKLMKEISRVPLDSLQHWPSPTNKRAFDGALHSTIIIQTKSNTYSHPFDDFNPHAEAKCLLKCIQKMMTQAE